MRLRLMNGTRQFLNNAPFFIRQISKYYLHIMIFLVVILLGIILYFPFVFGPRMYIYTDVGSDTLNAYWPFYEYFIMSIKSNNLNMWSDSFGMGNSIFSIWPWLADPFNLFLLLDIKSTVPEMLVNIMIVKLGITAVMIYCYLNILGFNNKSNFIVAIMSTFNGYIILWGQHYIFSTMFLLCIIVLYLLERYFITGKWLLLMLSVAFFSSFSVYFLYQFTIYLVLYIIMRLILKLEKISIIIIIQEIGRLASIYLLGVLLSSVIMLPQINAIFSGARINTNSMDILSQVFLSRNTLEQYLSVFRVFSNDVFGIASQYYGYSNYYESPILYSGLLSLIIIPYGISKSNSKQKLVLSVFVFIFAMIYMFPFTSYIFNAFSAFAFRWTFIYILLSIYLSGHSLSIIAEVKNQDSTVLDKNMFVIILLLLSLILVLTLVMDIDTKLISNTIMKLIEVLMFLMFYYVILKLILNNDYKRSIWYIILIVVCFEVIVGNWGAVNERKTLHKEMLSNKILYNDFTNEAVDYTDLDFENYERIEKDFSSVFLNDNLIQHYNGTKSYSSLNKSEYIDFLTSVGVPQYLNHVNYIRGLDGSAQLASFHNVKYFLTKKNNFMSYGYEFVNKFGDVNLYINNNFLPMGIFLDEYMSYSDFMKYPVNYREDVIFDVAVVSDNTVMKTKINKVKQIELDKENYVVDEAITEVHNANSQNDTIDNIWAYTSSTDDPQVYIPNLALSGMKFIVNLNVNSAENSNAQLFWTSSPDDLYTEQQSKYFSVVKGNNSYQVKIDTENLNSIRLDIGNKNQLIEITNLSIDVFDKDAYQNKINSLKNNSLDIQLYNDGDIRGHINTKDDGVLMFTVPYDSGWHAKIDGKEVEVLKVDIGFLGVELEKGSHKIELVYVQPYLKIGMVLSIIGIFITGLMLIYDNSFKKRVDINEK